MSFGHVIFHPRSLRPRAIAGRFLLWATLIASAQAVLSPQAEEGESANVFFLRVADRLLRSQFAEQDLSVTNIPVFPTNAYDAAVHRLLQVAANMVESTTNWVVADALGPAFPHVFRPIFRKTDTNASVAGFVEETNSAWVNLPWQRLETAANLVPFDTNGLVQGIPAVIGVVKGYPNFNEYEMNTSVQFTRRLEFVRPNVWTWRISQTNQLHEIGLSNRFTVESWNPYGQAYPRRLRWFVTNQVQITLLTNNAVYTNVQLSLFGVTNLFRGQWGAKQFQLPFQVNLNWRPFGAFPDPQRPLFTRIGSLPTFWLAITNRLMYALIDQDAKPVPRVVDFVNLNNLECGLDISAALVGLDGNQTNDTAVGKYWFTNLVKGYVPIGVLRQIDVSLGNVEVSDAVWSGFSGQDKYWSIDHLRVFAGLVPKYNTGSVAEIQNQLGQSLVRQLPFTVTRKFNYVRSWQANDPLVHYAIEDLNSAALTNGLLQWLAPPHTAPTNFNIGMTNQVYCPWAWQNWSIDTNCYYVGVKDPGIRSPDDWSFPTDVLANLSDIGRVHRGTPWQTIYLKSEVANKYRWLRWAGNARTHPTNDWRIASLLVSLWNTNNPLERLSVNESRTSEWGRILDGLTVQVCTMAGSPQTNWLVVSGNSPEMDAVVQGINRTRQARPYHRFSQVADLLATPELSMASPWFNASNFIGWHYVYERTLESVSAQLLPRVRADALLRIQGDATSLGLQVQAEDLLPCTLESSTDLVHWEFVRTLQDPADSFQEWGVDGTTDSQRFFRVILGP